MLKLLQKYEKLFDGTLGKYTGSNCTKDFKEDAKPYHAKPFPIPNIQKPTLKKEVDGLIKITRQAIIPLPDKVQAIKNLKPTNKKQLRSFIGGQ